MKNLLTSLSILIILQSWLPATPQEYGQDRMNISVVWKDQKPSGSVAVLNGSVNNISIGNGKGKVRNNQFSFSSTSANSLILKVHDPEPIYFIIRFCNSFLLMGFEI